MKAMGHMILTTLNIPYNFGTGNYVWDFVISGTFILL